MLTMLGGLAEFERELIRARTSEGRPRAKARGVKLGRAFKLTPEQRRQALARLDAGEVSREIARTSTSRTPLLGGCAHGRAFRFSDGRAVPFRRAQSSRFCHRALFRPRVIFRASVPLRLPTVRVCRVYAPFATAG
jgi:hypothetical protein